MRAAQHLDALEVDWPHVDASAAHAGSPGNRRFAKVTGHRGADKKVLGLRRSADASDDDRVVLPAAVDLGHTGDRSQIVLHANDAAALDILAADHRDAHRDILQPLLALCRGDDDLFD